MNTMPIWILAVINLYQILKKTGFITENFLSKDTPEKCDMGNEFFSQTIW